MPWVLAPGAWVISRFLRVATIATMPMWMRKMAGLRQPRILDLAVLPIMKISFWLTQLSPRLEVLLLQIISPSTVPVAGPVLLGIPPMRDEILTPAEARERYGYQRPSEAHLELRERQRVRVLGERLPPSDEGLVESEAILGPMA